MRALLLCLALLPALVQADDYQVSVSREGRNIYKVVGKEIYIHTRYCYEYVSYEDSLLRMAGTSGKIVFLDSESSCDVKGVYTQLGLDAGNYEVTVSHEDDDWYEVFGTDTYVKTSLCLNLSLADAAILKVRPGGSGTLIFIDDEDTCMVEGIFGKARL